MKESLEIIGLRGSLFMPNIPFSQEILDLCNTIFPNCEFYPIVNHTDGDLIISSDGKVISQNEWWLISKDKKINLYFSNQKIDIQKDCDSYNSQPKIVEFSSSCNKLFSQILEKTKKSATRIAIAPSYEFAGDRNQFINYVNNTIYRKNTFNSCTIDRCDFSQVYRIKEIIQSKPIEINYLSKFQESNKIVNNEGNQQIKRIICINFDINTSPKNEYAFDTNSVNDFFTNAPTYCSKFINHYFSEE